MAIEVGEGFGIVGDHGVEVESLRSASDPRKFAALESKIVIQTQIILGRFGYRTKFTGELDSQTREALRQYQANKGIRSSGEVDILTYFGLTEDDRMADEQLVSRYRRR
jgi:hypothetical protein